MRHWRSKIILVLVLSLALFHASFQLQDFSMYSDEEMQRHAHFIQHPFSVLSVPAKILSSSVNMTSLDCSFNCLQTASCVSFNFGIQSKLCQLLATDKYSSSEKFESSQEFDHHSIATPCVYQRCPNLTRCQPIYTRNDFVCVSTVRYFLAATKENCYHKCESHHLQCVKAGGFPRGNALEIFKGIGIECKRVDHYWAADQPCYEQSSKKCHGAKSIPNEINCEEAKNPSVRRLCPCYN